MKANLQEKIWNEKYRPSTVEDCILPKRIKDNFESYLKAKDFPNLLLVGGAGQGKCLGYDTELDLMLDGNKIKIKIGELFEKLGMKDIPLESLAANPRDIFIKMPNGDYTKIIGFVKKRHEALSIKTESGRCFIGSTKHIVLDKNSNEVFLEDASELLAVENGETNSDSIVEKKSVGVVDLYDITIPAPHLYCDYSGVIHHNTTIAKALCNEMDIEYLFINASDERNIDVVRTKIKEFSSTISMSGKDKAVLLDEADGLAPLAQGALRAAIEEFSNVKFILTANFKNKLIDPLISRMAVVDFKFTKEEKQETIKLMAKRVLQILDNEGVDYDSKSVLEVVKKYFPDNRKIINTLNQYGLSGSIDSGIIQTLDGSSISTLIDFLKQKDFRACRQWSSDNSDMDMELIYKELYEQCYNRLKPESRPEFCVVIARYAYQSGIVVNQEINLAALLAELITLEYI